MRFWLRCAIFSLVVAIGFSASAAYAAEGSLEIPIRASEIEGAPITERLRLYSASKALVIGIDNYGGSGWFSQGGSWPQLSLGIKDAEEVAKSLKAKGFAVTLLTDPGSNALKSAMEDFFIREGADPESRLLIWFAGHGHTINGEGYLVPTDAPNPNKDEIEFRRKALSLRRFGEFMRGANAKHVLAVFDSCFAGTIFDVARALPPRAITRATTLKVRQFVSSGDADQVVADNGRFRRIFLDALDGKEPAADPNGDGFITGSELGMFLADKITNLSERGQTPRYGKLIAEGYDRGDFVLEKGTLELPPATTPDAAGQTQPPTKGAETEPTVAERAWALVQSSEDIALLEAFRKQFSAANPFYDSLAASRITSLKEAKAKADATAKAKRIAAQDAAEAKRARDDAAPRQPAIAAPRESTSPKPERSSTGTAGKNDGTLFEFLWGADSKELKRVMVTFPHEYSAQQIIISFGDRKLYWVYATGQAISYPIAIPVEKARWMGKTTVTDKEVNPWWRPSPEMLKENPKLPSEVPGGHPMNPLGVRSLCLGDECRYRITGTDAPWTIGTAVDRVGDTRMYNEDILDLYPRVPVGTMVVVTWKPFLERLPAQAEKPVRK